MDTAETSPLEEEYRIVPAYQTWTPCENRADPDSWDGVIDEPYDGDYHDPEAIRADAD